MICSIGNCSNLTCFTSQCIFLPSHLIHLCDSAQMNGVWRCWLYATTGVPRSTVTWVRQVLQDTHATELGFPTMETNSFVLLSAVQSTPRTRQLSVITASDNSKCKNSEVSRPGQQAENLNIRIMSVTYMSQQKNIPYIFKVRIQVKIALLWVVCYNKLQFNSPRTEAINSLLMQ
jgi:hypothetical protein